MQRGVRSPGLSHTVHMTSSAPPGPAVGSGAAFAAFREKMQQEALTAPAIAAFQRSFSILESGESAMIGETEIEPAADILDYTSLPVY